MLIDIHCSKNLKPKQRQSQDAYSGQKTEDKLKPMIGPTRNGRQKFYTTWSTRLNKKGGLTTSKRNAKLTVGFILPTFHPTGTCNPGISTIYPIVGGFLSVGFPKPKKSPTRYINTKHRSI